MPMCDYGAREGKWLLEEVHARIFAVREIRDLSFSCLVSVKVSHALHAMT